MPIYCDESGYTGYNLLQENQPYFVYAALNIEEAEAIEFISAIKTKYHLQGEPKGMNLVRSKNGQAAIRELFEKYSKSAQIVYYHKKYALACKYFEYVFEPAVYDNSRVFYYTHFHRFIANLVFEVFKVSSDKAEDIFLRFQELLRGNDPNGLFHLLQSRNVPNELSSMVAEFTQLNRQAIMDEIITDDKYDFWILDLAQTALHSLLSVWSMKLGALAVIADESLPLREAVERNPLYHRINEELVYADPFGDGETALNFSLSEPIRFENSRKTPGLQMADLFASSMYWALMHPEDDLSKLVLQYQGDFIPKPNNVCIMPEPDIYLQSESIGFANGVVSLKYLVDLSRESTEDLGMRYSKLMLKKVAEYKRQQGLSGPNYTPPKKKRKKRNK